MFGNTTFQYIQSTENAVCLFVLLHKIVVIFSYVVSNEQTEHFNDLVSIFRHIKRDDIASCIEHVKFGFVRGMSTRHGNVRVVYSFQHSHLFYFKAVYVDELLATGTKECAQLVLNDAKKSGLENNEHAQAVAAHHLALSALLTADLKMRRTHDYE